MPRGSHWLNEWMLEFGVDDAEQIADRLKSKAAVERLQQIASTDVKIDYGHVPLTGTVVAGPGIEIDAPGFCSAFNCIKQSIDDNFTSLLHYFDYVVMQGPSARSYASFSDDLANRATQFQTAFGLEQDVRTLAYLNNTGISNYIVFANKPECFCNAHFSQAAAGLGIEDLVTSDSVTAMAQGIRKRGHVLLRPGIGGGWYGWIEHPLFMQTAGVTLRSRRKPTKVAVAERIIRNQLMAVVFSAAAAKRMGLPMSSLAQPAFFDGRSSERSNVSAVTVDDVATRLKLPILSDLGVAAFVALREREPAHFESFRASLREAVAETLAKYPTASPEAVGEIAWHEKLKPALADLERRISVNRTTLGIRSGIALSIGSVSTAVASVVTAPWMAAMLGTAIAATMPLTQISDYLRERQQVETSNMYFLWKAKRSQNHN